jgi:hypothetical protein
MCMHKLLLLCNFYFNQRGHTSVELFLLVHFSIDGVTLKTAGHLILLLI